MSPFARILDRFFSPSSRASRPASRRTLVPRLDSLEDRTVPTLILPGAGNPGPLTINGTEGNDKLFIRMSATEPGKIAVSDTGGIYANVNLSDVTEIRVNGFGGADVLELCHCNGFTGRAGGLIVRFNGGPGRDVFYTKATLPDAAIVDYVMTEVYDVGRYTVTNGSQSLTVMLNQVNETIDMTTATTFNFKGNGLNNLIRIENGDAYNGTPTLKIEGIDRHGVKSGLDLITTEDVRVDPTGPSADSFIPIRLANKRNVNIKGASGGDTIVLDTSRAVNGLLNLNIDGEGGVDRLIGDDVPTAALLNVTNVETRIEDAAQEQFIEDLYHTRLKRDAQGWELDYWKQILNSPNGQAKVYAGIEDSVEAMARKVRDWYAFYLGRASSLSEDQYWVDRLFAGEAEESIVASLLGSSEFLTRAGTLVTGSFSAESKFVRSLYTMLLGRPASDGEANVWVAQIPTIGRAGVAITFLVTPEFRGRAIHEYYTLLMGRAPSGGERDYWLNTGAELDRIRAAFHQSLEYLDDKLQTATGVTLGGQSSVAFNGTSVGKDDRKYYVIRAPKTGTMTFSVGTNNSVMSRLAVVNSVGHELGETNPYGGPNSVTINVQANVLYFFRVRSVVTATSNFFVVMSIV